ncbi:MAG: gfo/Idh/MocA family oxidoreductase, partial [Acidobacteriota bacterium]|nr:gfo/Idh/MocA family oxidoreductase [Acidobacteriota bacterium]
IDTFRYLLGEVSEVYAHLRRLNPAIRGEETGQVFFRFAGGATAIWDANRYNEVETASPRYTFGEMRIDGMGGHITLDREGNLRVKRLGEAGYDAVYAHRDINFAGDCVYGLQRHFTDAMLEGREFEASGADYLKTLAVVEAVYESAGSGQAVRL